MTRDAFHRLDAWHRCQTGLTRACCSLTPARPTPVRPRRSCSAVTRERPTRATRRSCRSPCGRRERRTGRCPSPTSATDPQHEHPRNRWTPRLLRLSAPSARVKDPVDASPPASVALLTLAAPQGTRSAGFRTGAAPWPACSAARVARSETSDAPCHRPGRPAQGETSRTAKGRFRRALVKERSLRHPERLPSPGLPHRQLA